MEYKVTYRLGKIVLPKPTGITITDSDGWSWEQYSDGYTLLPDGTKTDFFKWEPVVKIRKAPPLSEPTLLRRWLWWWK